MPEVRLEPVSDQQYVEYRERSEASNATNTAASGVMPLLDTRRKAAEDHQRLLPKGLRTPGHYFWIGTRVSSQLATCGCT